MQDDLCDVLDLDVIETAKLIKKQVDASMANGIATELRTRGFEPKEFTVLAYGGNGPLHACGIASALGVAKVLAPPYSSTFSACGAGTVNQMHIHEMNTWTVLFNPNTKSFFLDFDTFNRGVEEPSGAGARIWSGRGWPRRRSATGSNSTCVTATSACRRLSSRRSRA